jgi:hypothetical protein
MTWSPILLPSNPETSSIVVPATAPLTADGLKALQAPLKARYQQEPESARLTDASDEQLATLLKLSERYCVIYQTLKSPPGLSLARAPS